MKTVGVIGAGMTLFRRRLQETGKEMCFEATKMALDSAGLTRADVDMVVNGTAPDAFDGVRVGVAQSWRFVPSPTGAVAVLGAGP